jgi:ABC-type lipoprotein export system ATPase subunit
MATTTATRGYLPIDDAKVDILSALERSQVVVIRGETGSGKTTQVMQTLTFLLVTISKTFFLSKHSIFLNICLSSLKTLHPQHTAASICFGRSIL